jgi:hypothetical protein
MARPGAAYGGAQQATGLTDTASLRCAVMTPQTRPDEDTRLSRRAALGLGAGGVAVLLSGCALNNPLGDDKTPAADAVRDLTPDVAVAVEAASLIRGAQAAVTSSTERHPALATRLAGLLAMHRAHLDAVVDAVPDGVDTSASPDAYVVPARPARALVQLTAAERSLHDGLVGLAMRAESGAFARLLGAMAAAVSQRALA